MHGGALVPWRGDANTIVSCRQFERKVAEDVGRQKFNNGTNRDRDMSVSDDGSGRIYKTQVDHRVRVLLRPSGARNEQHESKQAQREDMRAHCGRLTQRRIGVSMLLSTLPFSFARAAGISWCIFTVLAAFIGFNAQWRHPL